MIDVSCSHICAKLVPMFFVQSSNGSWPPWVGMHLVLSVCIVSLHERVTGIATCLVG